MKIEDLFVAKVTRDIPPVVYFHEQSPEKLRSEVDEYIVTGGYPEGDPRNRRVKSGIHEQFVHLLRGIVHELTKKGGPELPASWISGFYGSGKSSFAKLLGLSLDGVVLPDGTPLGTALLQRDDSPLRQELVNAWAALAERVSPIAVVFDIGGVARDNEHIHSAVLRLVQKRLDYSSKSNLVADFELRLERDGEWERFLETARTTLGKEWKIAKEEEQADDHFSHVLHVMKPDRYPDPTSWIDSRAGSRTGAGTSVREVVEAIEAMLDLREAGKSLFLVVDEVSQYVHQDESRMPKLQSFVSELGQRLKGRVWLLATGQQQLEDQAETNNLAKLKDRFPSNLRVHLATTPIDGASDRERAIEEIRDGLRLARDLGAGSVLLTLGWLRPDLFYDEAYANGVRSLRELVPAAEEYGVDIGVEFVWNGFLFSPMEMARFLDEVGSPRVGFYFDTGNMAVFQYPQHWVRILGERVKLVHFKDWKGNALGGAWTPLLEGGVDFSAVMRELRSIGYGGPLTGEVEPFLASLEKTAAAIRTIMALPG